MASPRDAFDPHAHRTSRAFVSNCAAWAHLLNGLLALWLVLHVCLFAALGLVGAILILIILAASASYALHMMLRNELAICCEQQVPWLGLPRALELACVGGPRPLRAMAVCLRVTAYAMYIVLGITIITCHVIITSLLLGYLWELFLAPIDHHLYVLLLAPLLLLGSIVPNLRFMWPVSVAAVLAVACGCLVLVADVLQRPAPAHAPALPALASSQALGLPFFVAAELVALSFIIVVVVVEKHMDNPPRLLGVRGYLNWCLVLAIALQTLVSTTIYVKFGSNLSFDFLTSLSRNILLDVVIFLFVFGALLAVPLYVYALHDIIWDMHQHLLQKYSESQKLFCEFGLRVMIITLCTVLALFTPAYGKKHGLPVALTVPLLLWGFPALIEIALCWQVRDFGPYKFALWKDVLLIVLTVVCLAFAILYQVAG